MARSFNTALIQDQQKRSHSTGRAFQPTFTGFYNEIEKYGRNRVEMGGFRNWQPIVSAQEQQELSQQAKLFERELKFRVPPQSNLRDPRKEEAKANRRLCENEEEVEDPQIMKAYPGLNSKKNDHYAQSFILQIFGHQLD